MIKAESNGSTAHLHVGDAISQHLIETGTLNNNDSEQDNDNLKEINFANLLGDSFIKISGCSNKILRSLKSDIEELIVKKIKALDDADITPDENERSVYYMKDMSIDKVGHRLIVGQTGIAEGWDIPIYKSEYQNLLGLPFTEDHALSDKLRMKKPKQECFNCLSSDHRVTDCPVKINNERIAMHRSEFNSQSIQSQDQMNLFSTRYTNDIDSQTNRGFVPGNVSDQLKEALGCKPNQLPPFIYLMREFGYPEAWLIEARVDSANKLSVLNGDMTNIKTENGLIKEELAEEVYDQNKIFSFVGFNEQPPSNFIDESDRFGVQRYNEELSRDNFLKTLKIEKKKVPKRRSMYQSETPFDEESTLPKEQADESLKDQEETNETSKADTTMECADANSKEIPHGISFNEIPGTPIVDNSKGVSSVPDWAKFSENICEHKCFEMGSEVSTGSYQKIVSLTREFKTAIDKLDSNYDE